MFSARGFEQDIVVKDGAHGQELYREGLFDNITVQRPMKRIAGVGGLARSPDHRDPDDTKRDRNRRYGRRTSITLAVAGSACPPIPGI